MKRQNILNILLGLMLIGEILCLFYYNLTTDYVFDQDAAKVMYHTVKIFENKSFIIPSWAYMTTGEWDCTSFLALFIYGITNNIILSFSISNIINILLFGLIVYILLSSIGLSKRSILFALAILYIPYGWGMLAYTNMLFYSAGQYIYKVLTPLSLLALLHYHDKYKNKIIYYLLFILTLLLIFLTTTSSGLYVAGCGLFGIYVSRLIYYLINRKDIRKENIIELIICLVVLGVSYYLHNTWGVYSNADTLSTSFKFHIKEFIESFIDVLNIEFTDPLLSAINIAMIFKIILLIFIVIFGLLGIRRIFKVNKNNLIILELLIIFIINSIVITLWYPTSRYQLIGFIPLVLVSIINFEDFKFNKQISYVMFVCLFILNVILQYNSYVYINYVYKDNYSRTLCEKVLNTAYENNADIIVWYNAGEYAEVSRVYDSNIEILSYFTSDEKFIDYDVVDGIKDKNYIEDKNAIILIPDSYNIDELSDYIKENYKWSYTEGAFLVYIPR